MEQSNEDLMVAQKTIADRLESANDRVAVVCESSEAELAKVEKWVREQLVVIADTRANFDYISKSLKKLQQK